MDLGPFGKTNPDYELWSDLVKSGRPMSRNAREGRYRGKYDRNGDRQVSHNRGLVLPDKAKYFLPFGG